jgi:leader peptidase (prepilin peptidase)/N-methyltransferase
MPPIGAPAAPIAPPVRAPRPWRPRMLAWQVPVALALGAIAIALLGADPLLFGVLALAAVTPELMRVDLAEHRLPDLLTLPGYPVTVAAVLLSTASGRASLPTAVLSGGGALVLFLLLAVAGGMGLGDVKLAGVLGLLLGARGVEPAMAGLLVAFLAGGIAAVPTLVRQGTGARVPFGPFLLAGFWLGLAVPV